MKIGIIAALPGELRPLVTGWYPKPHTAAGVKVWQRPYHADEVTAACAGMGAHAVSRALSAAEAGHRLDVVLSIGWAGALVAGRTVGQTFGVPEVIDARTGERFALAGGDKGERLVTCTRVVDQAEKQRLGSTYGATLVDMETATIARLAQMRGIPVYCFKAVSDDASARLPDINPFINNAGALRTASLLAHVAVRPRFWRPMLQLGRGSAIAARALAATVEAFLAQRDRSVARGQEAGSV